MIDGWKSFAHDKNIDWTLVDQGVWRKIMTYNAAVMMVKVKFEKGAIGTLHHHPHIQISYVSKGSFEVEIDKAKCILQEGDAFLVQSGKTHGVVCLEEGILIDVFNPIREDFIEK